MADSDTNQGDSSSLTDDNSTRQGAERLTDDSSTRQGADSLTDDSSTRQGADSLTDDSSSGRLQDQGWAWMVVIGCFLAHLITGGLERSDGVFYLKLLSRYNQSAQLTSWAGALSGTIMLAMGPLASAMCNRYSARTSVMAGGLLYVLGLILSGLAPSLPVLLLCFGLIQGIGRGLTYAPGLIMVSMYFNRKRGLGVGLSTAGVGAGTFLLPPLVELLFEVYGFSGGFLVLGGLAGNVFLVAMLYRPLSLHRWIVFRHRREQLLQTSPRQDPEMACDTNSSAQEDMSLRPSTCNANSCKHAGTVSSRLLNCSPSILEPEEMCPLKSSDSSSDLCARGDHETDETADSELSRTETRPSELEARHYCQSQTYRKRTLELSQGDNGFEQPYCGAQQNQTGRYRQQMNLLTPQERPLTHYSFGTCASRGALEVGGDESSESDPKARQVAEIQRGATDSSHEQCYIMYTATRSRRAPGRCGWLKSVLATCFPTDRQVGAGGGKERGRRRLVEWGLLRDRVFVLYCFSICLFTAALKSSLVFLPPLAKSRGVSELHAAYLLSVSGVLDTVGRVTSGVVLELRPLRRLRPLFFTSFIFLLSALYVLAPSLSSLPHFAALMGLLGLLTGAYVCQKSVILVDLLGSASLASSFGLLTLFQGIGNCLGPPLSGLLRDELGRYDEAFYLCGALLALSGFLMALANRCHAKKTH